jgi:hypothetical protein
MIWHIVKKDLRLLWPLALFLGALHVLLALMLLSLDQFGEPSLVAKLWGFLKLVVLLAMGILAVALMQQDVIPGVRQDWLIRPIKRLDLLLAKLVFALLLIVAPLVMVELVSFKVAGFHVLASLTAALRHGTAIFLFIALPAMLLGVFTRNGVEALIGTIALLALGFGLDVAMLMRGNGPGLATGGLSWLLGVAQAMLALGVAMIVLPLQFFRRTTLLARSIAAVGVVAAVLMIWGLWPAAFAVHQKIADPNIADAIALQFDPTAGPYRPAVIREFSNSAVATRVYLPLQFVGLNAESRIVVDRVDMRLIGADGVEYYRGQVNASSDGITTTSLAHLQVPPPPLDEQASKVYQAVLIPHDVYEQLNKQTVRIELDYAMTLMQEGSKHTVAAWQTNAMDAALGSCNTRLDSDGDELQLACVSANPLPTCFTAFLQHKASGLRNPEQHFCEPDYAKVHLPLEAAFFDFGVELPFLDPAGLQHYPVDATKLEGADIVIKPYEPQAHFTRSLVIPRVRLGEWLAQAASAP